MMVCHHSATDKTTCFVKPAHPVRGYKSYGPLAPIIWVVMSSGMRVTVKLHREVQSGQLESTYRTIIWSSSPPANVDCVIYEVSDSSQRLLDSIVSPDHDAGRVHHNYTQLINSCHLHTCSFQTTSQAEGWWHWLSRIIRNVKKKNLNVSRALMWPLAAPYIEDKCRRWHRFRVSALN